MSAGRAVEIFAAVVIVVQSTWVAVIAAGTSDYFGDDIWLFYQSRTLPIFRYFTATIDVHPVPLHRVLDYFVCRLVPMHFGAAVGFLLGVHWLSLIFLYASLQALKKTPANAVLAAWYGTYVYLGTVFSWWTAAAHRIPAICLTMVGVFAFVRYRRTHTPGSAAAVILSFLGALGFFEKAALVPIVLMGVELALWPRTPRADRIVHARLLGGLLVLACAYYFLWRAAVGPSWSHLYLTPSTLILFTGLGWKVLAASFAGFTFKKPWIGIALGLSMVAFTVYRARWNAVVWLVAAAVLSVSLASTGFSHIRTSLLGLLLPVVNHRYYPDVMAVAVIFAAIAWHFALEAPVPTDGWLDALGRSFSGWRGGVLAAVVMSVTAARALDTYRTLAPNLYAPIHRYMSELRRGLADVPPGSMPLRIQEGRVPDALSGLGPTFSRHSVLLTALGVPFVLAKPGPGVYRISRRGALEPSWHPRPPGTGTPR